jgi:Flp pilus assembly protein TadB
VSDPADDRRDEARRAQLAMRVGSEERERAVAELREHFTAGRLTADELEDRTRDAFGARTVGDLARLLHDLPVAGTRLPARSARHTGRPGLPAAVVVALVVLALVLLLALPTGGRALLPLLVGVALAVVIVRWARRDA